LRQRVLEASGLSNNSGDCFVEGKAFILYEVPPDSTEVEARKEISNINVEDISLVRMSFRIRKNRKITISLKSV
jgi:hypothetical protein